MVSRVLPLHLILAFAGAAAGCGDDVTPVVGATCDGFVVPDRLDVSACAEVDALEPDRLVECLVGSGHAGRWAIDADGLPAYDLTIDQRCDPAGQSWSPRPAPLSDPIHILGNGRGVVAMAHASGGIELYSQDRGHKWLNRIDGWRDAVDPSFPIQLGGGFSYLVVDGEVRSTRFEDLPVGEALARQTRRFGVGYVETVTTFDDLRVTRRVLAPDAEARALIAEVTVENLAADEREVGLVELWDANLSQLSVELATSDLLSPVVTEGIERDRRALAAEFRHTARYSAEARALVLETRASAPPDGLEPTTPSEIDYFPDPMYLAALDGDAPDAAWLVDDELWPDPADRRPPARAAAAGEGGSRQVELDGAGQHAVLAARVPLTVAPGAPVTRRFAFGYLPGGGEPDAALAELRAVAATVATDTATAWHDRLVWLAAPGLEAAGAMQREIAWASYGVQALVTRDAYYGTRLLGQGGSYKWVHGIDGAIGDYALFAQSLLLIDPALARDTLALALATQHGQGDPTPGRFPYATTGHGAFTDVGLYDLRSDAYFVVPSEVARYVALTRDTDFLAADIGYWPLADGDHGTVTEHLQRILDFATTSVGFGARGFVAMGTGDYADGVLRFADEPATPGGTSSLYNVGFILTGFPRVASVLADAAPALAQAYAALADDQRGRLEDGWSGTHYHRGFVDSGNPLAADKLFLEPQLLPILAGAVDASRRDALLALIDQELESELGALSVVDLADGGEPGGIDRPQVGGVWPVANAWLTEAYALADPAAGWRSFVKNSLANHATLYPGLWYGIWTGPDSFNGPDNARPGEADAHVVTALTDYPVGNAHIHTSPLRALMALLGVDGDGQRLRIAPRLPVERFAVTWPRLALDSAADRLTGRFVPTGSGAFTLELLVPSALRAGAVAVAIDGAQVSVTRTGDLAAVEVVGVAGQTFSFAVTAAP